MIGKIVRYSLLRERRSSAVSRPKGMCLFARELRPITGGAPVTGQSANVSNLGGTAEARSFVPCGAEGFLFLQIFIQGVRT